MNNQRKKQTFPKKTTIGFTMQIKYSPSIYTPRNEVVGDVLESSCPSVCRRNGFRALDHYPYHLESPYHTYGLPIGGRYSLLILRSKGQRSSGLDIKVEIRFLGSRQISLPPRVTISHIWTTHRRKMFPIDFEVKGQVDFTSK
jgi:hypothetical protein